jgi:DNA-binding NarL/FixJ family response regulator
LIRALIISNGFLFSSVIESLLSHEEDLFVITTNKGKVIHLLEEVHWVQPSVVITDTFNFYQKSEELDELLAQFPKLRLIVIDQKQNYVYVYEKKQFPIVAANDLLNVIKMNC